ncbi:ROK family protein [Neorhizobium sp. Rsf11]|uniref:ROK family protein n=2 Tax=Neorhizobium TaxID=1525371 RepID=A0ABV0MAV6_9HYPH|nr:ROK family protein [Neorhizobium petrolearium]MCC2613813.1 ROK family protein [Neorhizobium petrolearium]WGI72122.1 ROK family protein [Neorhizobium petrolearium]
MLIGIDIGGTAIKAGAVGGGGRVWARRQVVFDRSLAFDALIARLSELTEALQKEAGETASSIGVCLPGFVDRLTGMLVDGGANVSALREKPLAKSLSAATGLPVHVENDGVAATVGEAYFGAGRGLRRFMLLTIGTGIGGAVYIDGSVVTGSRGEPPEIGAVMLREDDGTPANFEKLACAGAFLERYKRHSGKEIGSLPELFQALGHDEAAARTVDEIGRIIARVFAPLINALNLEACIVGGGVAAAGEALLKPIRIYLPELTWPMLARNNQVLQAACGNDAGLLGVAWLAQNAAKMHAAAQ